MKVITTGMRKGGQGKTTITRYLGEYAARFAKQRVLLVDLDNQANLSKLMLNMEVTGGSVRPPIVPGYDPTVYPDWNGRNSVAGLIRHGNSSTYEVTKPKVIEGLEILPADLQDLFDLERDDDPALRKGLPEVFSNNLHRLLGEHFDLCIIDTGPTANMLMYAALSASSHMLIPFTPDPQSTGNLDEMIGLYRAEARRRGPANPMQLLGLLPMKVRTNVAQQEVEIEKVRRVASLKPFLLPHQIPDRTLFQELDADNPVPTSVFDISDQKRIGVKEVMIKLCADLLNRIEEGGR